MNQSHDVESVKKAYEKPTLRVIQLTAEEVLSIGCKTNSGGIAPGHPPPCAVSNCAKAGS